MGQSRWVLVAIEGRYSGSRYPITERGVSFGREADNDLVLDDENVSRHHAVLRVQRDRPVLEDLKSRNGTFVNNKKIARLELTEGDRIALGTHLFKVVPAMVDEPVEQVPEVDPERTIIAQHALGERREAPPTLASVAVSGPGTGRGRVALERLQTDPVGGRLEHATLQKGRLNLAGAEEPAMSGPIFGGAAAPYGVSATEAGGAGAGHQAAAPVLEMPAATQESGNYAPGDYAGGGYGAAAGGYGADAAPVARRGRGRQTLIAALGALVVVVVGGGVLALTQGTRTTPESTAVVPAGEVVEAPVTVMPPSGGAALFPPAGTAPEASKTALLTPEEQAMGAQERLARSKEHFDQGESFMESDKLKEAREEFQRAFALDAECKICLIRLSKVDGEIKKTLEKYKGDALRSQKALEYDKARRFWEMVLELESDPEGQRVARQGIAEARAQLQKQSYR